MVEDEKPYVFSDDSMPGVVFGTGSEQQPWRDGAGVFVVLWCLFLNGA